MLKKRSLCCVAHTGSISTFFVVDLLFLSFVCTLFAQNFRLVWVDSQSYIFSTLLEVA